MQEHVRDYCGTVENGTVHPRAEIYKVALHKDGDVFLSHEHFGSELAAQKMIDSDFQKKNPNDKLTVVKYLRA